MAKDCGREPPQAAGKDLKTYTKPTLTKGPMLGDVAAIAVSPGPSDIRLKRDIRPIGRTESGLTLYRFRYLWSDVEMVGVMAQEVLEVAPEAVIVAPDGFYRVDYARLGLRCTTYAEWGGTRRRRGLGSASVRALRALSRRDRRARGARGAPAPRSTGSRSAARRAA